MFLYRWIQGKSIINCWLVSLCTVFHPVTKNVFPVTIKNICISPFSWMKFFQFFIYLSCKIFVSKTYSVEVLWKKAIRIKIARIFVTWKEYVFPVTIILSCVFLSFLEINFLIFLMHLIIHGLWNFSTIKEKNISAF